MTTDPTPPDPKDPAAPTHEGKLVFSPNELNQAGEDKEYFPPDKDHAFDVPKDADDNELDLTGKSEKPLSLADKVIPQ